MLDWLRVLKFLQLIEFFFKPIVPAVEWYAALLDVRVKSVGIDCFAKDVLRIAGLSVLHLDGEDGKFEVFFLWLATSGHRLFDYARLEASGPWLRRRLQVSFL